jgi:phage gpG-like protein
LASSFTFTFDASGVERRLRRARERALDVSPALDGWADDVAEENRSEFASNGARFGRPWAELATGGPATLHDTGRLEESLTTRPFGVERITRDSAELGTDLFYARFLQDGTQKMPSRPFLELSAELGRKLGDRIVHHITHDPT